MGGRDLRLAEPYPLTRNVSEYVVARALAPLKLWPVRQVLHRFHQ